jgi:hypothetical protein
MNKAFVDTMIAHMKQGGIVAKPSPWMVEGMGEKAMNVRYVGLKITADWAEVFSLSNNLLLKFVIDRQTAYLEFYLANKPPFFRIFTKRFTENDKWEILLGDVRKRLKKDKTDYLDHKMQVGNLYSEIKPHLR